MTVTVFNPSFFYYDQLVYVWQFAWQITLLAMGVYLVIPLLLIPRPLHAFVVHVTAASCVVGVIGYASFWGGGVGLDLVTLLVVLMGGCFSADVAVHVVYAVAVDSGSTAGHRIRSALTARGFVALQAFLVYFAASSAFAWMPISALSVTWYRLVVLQSILGVLLVLIMQSALLASLPNSMREVFSTAVGDEKAAATNQPFDEPTKLRAYDQRPQEPVVVRQPTNHRSINEYIYPPRRPRLDRLAYSRDISNLSAGNRLYTPPSYRSSHSPYAYPPAHRPRHAPSVYTSRNSVDLRLEREARRANDARPEFVDVSYDDDINYSRHRMYGY